MCVFGLTACGSDDDGGVNPSQFVGVWQATNVSGWELIDGEKEYFDEDLSGNISISGDIAIIEAEASDVYNKWTYKRISKDVSK
ncbi:MAG: hypothetical protein IJ633_07880 [Prevotella sp.]|nr:hypothetical protein [Prevotella sp.]